MLKSMQRIVVNKNAYRTLRGQIMRRMNGLARLVVPGEYSLE